MTEGWMPLGAYVDELYWDRAYLGFMQVLTNFNTRRIVQVSTRKYRSRKGRRR